MYKSDQITQKQLALGKMYHQQRKKNNNKKSQSYSLFKWKINLTHQNKDLLFIRPRKITFIINLAYLRIIKLINKIKTQNNLLNQVKGFLVMMMKKVIKNLNLTTKLYCRKISNNKK